MRLIEYLALQIDEAIEMLYTGKTKDEVACFLGNLKKDLVGKEKVMVDEDKTKYLEDKYA